MMKGLLRRVTEASVIWESGVMKMKLKDVYSRLINFPTNNLLIQVSYTKNVTQTKKTVLITAKFSKILEGTLFQYI